MKNSNDMNQPSDATCSIQDLLMRQRQAFAGDLYPTSQLRIDRINRIADIHIRYKNQIIDALSEDFGSRSPTQSLMTDVLSSVMDARKTVKEVAKWMKPQKRKTPLLMRLTGGRAEIQYQPLGVVGNIAPWNFPVALAFAPVIGALAAGNRAMIKPSELAPLTAEVIKEMIASAFDPEELVAVTGGVDVGQAFSALPFDHLVFTGGTAVAKHVMRAAAENLVPVTLELGGKCPVVVGRQANLKQVAERVLTMKMMNAGQLCLTPDYLFIAEGQREAFIKEAKAVLAKFYSSLQDNPDYTAIINSRHWQRLRTYLDELPGHVERIEEFNPANENFDSEAKHTLPPILIVEPQDHLAIMNEEIFGPFLSIKSYKNIDEAIAFINAKPRPLALYFFGKDKSEMEKVSHNTIAGGMTINDVAAHVSCDDLPLGGVGDSGMGSYHGVHGFRQFSHAKAMYKQGFISLAKFAQPPYTEKRHKMFAGMLK